jgi:regulator of vacuolar morphogenesis
LTSDIADDKPTETPIKQEYTSATWLSALNNQDASVITLRTLARKLDTTSQKMAVTGINAQNARSEFQRVLTEAQQQTTSIYGVLDELTAWLDDARELAPGERRRRSDLVSNMRAQVRTLEKLLDKHKNGSVGGSWEQRTIASSASPSSSFSFQRAPTGSSLRSTSTNTDRDSYDAPSGAARERAQLLSNSSPPRPMSRRVFGNAFASETPETQPLDNEGLVQLQRQHIKNQDAQLDELSNVLVRQKEIGFQIHDELTLQNQMLGDLETDVDRVKGKVDKANNQMKKIQ